MVVYIQQTKLHNHVFSYKDRYWKLHNEYHQHVQHVQQYRRTWPCPHAPIRRTNSVQTSTFLHPDHHARCGCWNQSHRKKKALVLIVLIVLVVVCPHPTKKTGSYTCHSQRDPGLYVHSVAGVWKVHHEYHQHVQDFTYLTPWLPWLPRDARLGLFALFALPPGE